MVLITDIERVNPELQHSILLTACEFERVLLDTKNHNSHVVHFVDETLFDFTWDLWNDNRIYNNRSQS